MLKFFLKGSKRYFALAVLFVVLQVIFELINPKMIGYTVDFIIGEFSSIPGVVQDVIAALGGRDYVMGHLYLPALIVILIGLLAAASRYLFRLFNSMGAEHLIKRMRDQLFDHIIHLPYSWHDANQTGDIIQRCTSDTETIKNFISEQLVNLVRMLVLISLTVFFMARIHIVLTIVALAFVMAVVGYSVIFHGKIGEKFLAVDTEEGKLSSIAQENLTGVRVVRAFGREQYERTRFEQKNETYIGHWVDMMKLLSGFWTINDFIKGLETLVVLSLGTYFTVKGRMTAGELVAVISYNTMIVQPIAELGRVISEMSKAGVSIKRIEYIMNSEAEKDDENAVDFPGAGDIVFEHVSFNYGSNNVLSDVSMTVKKGQTVGILGATGSGKSTLMLLLDGMYELSEGRITINGVDISKIKKSRLRKNIGFVLQEPYLFSRSLMDNIKIAKEDAEYSEVENAVEIAGLTGTISKFKEGYNTYVGERGVTLSGGQKQRTAIAQMIIGKPEIMIFDDSLSAVDAQTDAHIRAALAKASRNATVIIISHRITTIMGADRIYVLQDGKIKEQGSHSELINIHGIYSEIYDMQRAAEEDE